MEGPSADVDSQVSKYKKLLTLARSSLEKNQETLAKKDAEILELQAALLQTERVGAKEKARRVRGLTGSTVQDGAHALDSTMTPRRILCRVDVDDDVWILLEFEQSTDSGVQPHRLGIKTEWLSFPTTQAVDEYIARQPGAPLICPHRCLSNEDSSRIELVAQQRVDKVVEEFRRYKVKMEILRKNKDAEYQHMLLHGATFASGTNGGSSSNVGNSGGQNLDTSIDKAILSAQMLTDDRFGDEGTTSPSIKAQQDTAATLGELQNLKLRLRENESAWKDAYERVVRENELLHSRGGDVIASQWRERYDVVLREKDDLDEKVRILSSIDTTIGGGTKGGRAANNSIGDKQSSASTTQISGTTVVSTNLLDPACRSIEQMYVALKDEYKDFRRRTAALDQQHSEDMEDLRKALECYTNANNNNNTSNIHANSSIHAKQIRTASQRNSDSDLINNGSGGNMHESKSQYIRQMVLQYLLCKDPEVKVNIENALIAIFRFTEAEKDAIIIKRNDVAADPISSFTGIFSSIPKIGI
jgi:hypothetical protein